MSDKPRIEFCSHASPGSPDCVRNHTETFELFAMWAERFGPWKGKRWKFCPWCGRQLPEPVNRN